MLLAQRNDMIDALATDRSDHPLGEAVLPRCPRRDGLVADAHGSQSACDRSTVDRVPIADQVAWGLIPGECFGDLLRDPFCRRVSRHIDLYELSPSQPNNHQNIEQIEADGRNHEQIHGRDVRHMVAQEGAPALTRWAALCPGHVSGDG